MVLLSPKTYSTTLASSCHSTVSKAVFWNGCISSSRGRGLSSRPSSEVITSVSPSPRPMYGPTALPSSSSTCSHLSVNERGILMLLFSVPLESPSSPSRILEPCLSAMVYLGFGLPSRVISWGVTTRMVAPSGLPGGAGREPSIVRTLIPILSISSRLALRTVPSPTGSVALAATLKVDCGSLIVHIPGR